VIGEKTDLGTMKWAWYGSMQCIWYCVCCAGSRPHQLQQRMN